MLALLIITGMVLRYTKYIVHDGPSLLKSALQDPIGSTCVASTLTIVDRYGYALVAPRCRCTTDKLLETTLETIANAVHDQLSST